MGSCCSKSNIKDQPLGQGAPPPAQQQSREGPSQQQSAPAAAGAAAAVTAVATASTTVPPSDSSRWAAAYPAGVVPLPQYMTQTEYVLDASDTKCVTVSAIGSKEAGKSYVVLNTSSNDPAEQRPDLGGGEASLGLRLDSAAHIVWMDSKLSHGPTAARDGNMRDKICIRFSRVVLLVVNNVDNVVVAMDQIREHITSSQECFVIHNYLEGSVPRVPTDVINNTVAALRKGATGYGELMTETTPVLYLRHNKNDRWRHFFLSRDDHESNRAVYNHMRFVIGSYLPNARPIDELCRAVNTVATEMAECLVEQPVREPLLRAVRDRLQIQPSLAVATGKRTLAEVDTELRARGIEGYRVVPHTLTKERCHTTFPFDDDAYVLRFDIAVALGAAERIEQSVRAQLQWGEGIDLSKQRTGQTVIVRVVGPTAQLLQADLQVDEYAVGGGDAEPFIEVDIADGGTTLRVAVYFAPGSG